jgi:hypothetical protein
VEVGTLTCYKELMPKRALNDEDKKNEVLGVSVSSKTKEEIEGMAMANERSLSYIGGALLLRGLAAFHRDGQLKEPQAPTQQKTVTAQVLKSYRGEVKNDKKRA